MSDPWERCKLNREEEAKKLTRYLINDYKLTKKNKSVFDQNKNGTILNIDAKWGEGKTHFLECWREDLSKNHFVAYLDAWITDFSNDPLLAFLSAIKESISLVDRGNKKDDIKELAENIFNLGIEIAAKKYLKVGWKEIKSSLRSKDGMLLSEFDVQKRLIDDLRNLLGDLVEKITSHHDLYLPAFIFVDELDRCRPTYAVELLERIKHIFSIPGVQFVLATNTEELSHTVKAIYGNNFDAKNYLKRFFNIQYRFPEALKSPIIEDIVRDFSDKCYDYYGFKDNIDKHLEHLLLIINAFSIYFGWTVRDQLQIMEKLKHLVLLEFTGYEVHLVPLLYLFGLNSELSQEEFHETSFKSPEPRDHRRPEIVFKFRSTKVGGSQRPYSEPVEYKITNMVGIYQGLMKPATHQDFQYSYGDNHSTFFESSLYNYFATHPASWSHLKSYPVLVSSMGGLTGFQSGD